MKRSMVPLCLAVVLLAGSSDVHAGPRQATMGNTGFGKDPSISGNIRYESPDEKIGMPDVEAVPNEEEPPEKEPPEEKPHEDIRESEKEAEAENPVEEDIEAEDIKAAFNEVKETEDAEARDLSVTIELSALAIVLLLLILLVWRMSRRKNTEKARSETGSEVRTDPPRDEIIERETIKDPEPGDIKVTVRMIEGDLKGDNTDFYLRKDLIIGNDPSQCEIVIEGPEVSKRHARLYTEDDLIFIEDLNSEGGTFVGGMRIYAKNRVRSGDEIGIGDTGFMIDLN